MTTTYKYPEGIDLNETITEEVMRRGRQLEETMPRYDRIDNKGTLYDLKD